MATAKDVRNVYNTVRSDLGSKLSAVQDEKRKTEKSVVDLMKFKGDDEAKKLGKEARANLTKKFIEENKDMIAKYKAFSKENRVNENNFQEILKTAETLNPEVDKNLLRELIMGEKIESKEKEKKSLEFEKDTFRISSEGWEEVTKESAKKNPALKKFLDKGIKVKANATGDVVEYMEDKVNGALTCKKGEQIFITYDAFIREVCKAKNCTQEEAESKYMMTIEELQKKMQDKPDNSEEYKKFFNEEVNGHLAGYWDPSYKKFFYVAVRSHIWLVGGNTAGFYQNDWSYNNYNRGFGFSGRLLEN